MENHLAREHREKAAEFAKEALRRDPDFRNAHGELKDAMNGYVKDWAYTNHSSLIEFYKDHIDRNPNCASAYLDLLDQLLDDYRLTEAREYLDRYAAINDTYRVPLYRGLIEWYAGNRDTAFTIWHQVEQDFPDNWYVYQNTGDFLVRAERYAEALPYYRKALEIQKTPRYCDPIESIAQVCELMGDIPAAIAAWNEELELFDREWNFTEGESADVVRREIARLEAKQKK